MKTVITFDTATVTNSQQRQCIEEQAGFDLAHHLRGIAAECEKTGDLPRSRGLAQNAQGGPEIGFVHTVRNDGPEMPDLMDQYDRLTLAEEQLKYSNSLFKAIAAMAVRGDLDALSRLADLGQRNSYEAAGDFAAMARALEPLLADEQSSAPEAVEMDWAGLATRCT